MTAMPLVSSCATDNCSYNHDGCTAFAMNMGTTGCTTFIALDTRGGLSRVAAQVGACQRAECSHNSALECQAASVRIGSQGGECLSFELAK